MSWSPVHIERKHVVRLTRSEVWRLLSETDHLNRVIGMFSVSFSTVQKDTTGPYRFINAKLWRFIPMRWREYPFQWVTGRGHVVERIYDSGPLVRFIAGIDLTDVPTEGTSASPTATEIRFFADITPRNVVGYVALRFMGTSAVRRTIQYLDNHLRLQDRAEVMPAPRPQANRQPSVHVSELDRLLAQVAQAPIRGDYIPYLRRLITECDDDEVTSIRSYQFAADHNLLMRETLRVFLYATKVGIFNLNWNMMCPNCRVSKSEFGSLALVTNRFHCDFCGIEYDANFDNYVELQFSVHPNIRSASVSVFCVGGPMITPHVLVQRCVAPHATVHFPFPDTADKLRIRTLQSNHILGVVDADGSAGTTRDARDTNYVGERGAEYTRDGWSELEIARPADAGGLAVINQTDETIVVSIEKVQWSPLVVTAAEVTAIQEFRDLFGSEVLSPGQQVGIESVTLFFSDLRGSTALYESIGDAMAYGHVRKHFDLLSHWIAENSGSIVKTIGDAVMAVFYRPHQAVEAALQIQQNVAQFSALIGEQIDIKIGIHTGPAIAVNSNDRLDYFGRTVNIAARVQGCSHGGDIVMTQETLDRSDVQAVLSTFPLRIERFHTDLKGIDDEVSLARVEFAVPFIEPANMQARTL